MVNFITEGISAIVAVWNGLFSTGGVSVLVTIVGIAVAGFGLAVLLSAIRR